MVTRQVTCTYYAIIVWTEQMNDIMFTSKQTENKTDIEKSLEWRLEMMKGSLLDNFIW